MADATLGVGMVTKAAWNQMDVDVQDALPGGFAAVYPHIKPIDCGIFTEQLVTPLVEQLFHRLPLWGSKIKIVGNVTDRQYQAVTVADWMLVLI